MSVLGQFLKRLAGREPAPPIPVHDDPAASIAQARREFMAGRLDAALALVRGVLARHPERWDANAALGAVLVARGDAEGGARAYAAALRVADRDGDPHDTFVDLAIALCEAGRTREGATLLLERLPRAPSIRGHRQLATAALALGWYDVGWEQLEYRWLEGPVATTRQPHPAPPWRGGDLSGRTILLRAEQGIGDTVQFVRYAPLVRARGARVVFQPLTGTEAFSTRFDGIDVIATDAATVRDVDVRADLMSLPRAFGTTEATIPPPARLRDGDEAVVSRWHARLAALARPRVGLAWAGRPEHPRDRERSIALVRLRALFDVAGVAWVSLQKGDAAQAWASAPRPAGSYDAGPALDTLDDAVAAIACCDLVVSVDTAIAHLAGTLGVPTWVLVPTPADCRWLEDRDDSPWYPSMRLYRQARSRDWDPVIARVARDLASWARAPGAFVAAATRRSTRDPEPRTPPGLARVAETRLGLMQCDPSEERSGALLRDGECRARELDATLERVTPGATWIEAEAGVGAHAIAIARALGPQGRLIASESLPSRSRILANNLAGHGIVNVSLFTASVDALALDRLDGLKVGDAGAVDATLDGAGATLARLRPTLVLATDEARFDPLAARVRALGYRPRSPDATQFTLVAEPE